MTDDIVTSLRNRAHWGIMLDGEEAPPFVALSLKERDAICQTLQDAAILVNRRLHGEKTRLALEAVHDDLKKLGLLP